MSMTLTRAASPVAGSSGGRVEGPIKPVRRGRSEDAEEGAAWDTSASDSSASLLSLGLRRRLLAARRFFFRFISLHSCFVSIDAPAAVFSAWHRAVIVASIGVGFAGIVSS